MKLSKLIIGFTLSLLICLLTLNENSSILAAPQDGGNTSPDTAPKDPQPKDAVPPPQNPKDAVPPPQNPKDAVPPPQNPKDAVPPPQNPKDAVPPPQNPKDAVPPPQNPKDAVPPPQNQPKDAVPPPQNPPQTTPAITLTSTSFVTSPTTTTMPSDPINSPTFIPKIPKQNNGQNDGNSSSGSGSATKTIIIVASVIGGLVVLGGAAMAIFRYQKSISSDWKEEGEVVLRDGGEDSAGNPFKNTLDQYHR